MRTRRNLLLTISAPFLLMGALSVSGCRDPDPAIEQRVQTRLAEVPGGEGIRVDVEGRIAKLTGVVDSEAERRRVEYEVSRVDGVLAVQNRLVVNAPVTTTGATVDGLHTLAVSIDAQLAEAGFEDLDVVVEGGLLRVEGAVELGRHDQALEVARRAARGHPIDDETIVH